MKAVLIFVGFLAVMGQWAIAQDDKFKVQLLPITPNLQASAEKALQGDAPVGGKTVGEVNKNGVYTLTGDLFHDHRIYAIVDDNADVLICKWLNSSWSLLSVVNVQTVWNSPSGYPFPIVGRSPDNQQQPFWMLDLGGRPLLVIASYVEKAGQNYYVLLFDASRKQLLDWNSSFSQRPEVKDRYLITGDSSRVKSEFEATYYSKIRNNKFAALKSWDDSQPWHATQEPDFDDSSNYASCDGKGYIIVPDDSKTEHPADYIVVRLDSKENRPALPLLPESTKIPYAAVYFTPNKVAQGDAGLVYLFEKLTQLPSSMYPYGTELSTFDPPKAEPHWQVRVEGTDAELVKLLSLPSSNGRAAPSKEAATVP